MKEKLSLSITIFLLYTILLGGADSLAAPLRVSVPASEAPQARKITGTVVSTKGGPIPGATVFIKGTRTGTTTDFEGNFSLNAAAGDILEVSVLGFEGTEITVIASSSVYNVTLKEDVQALEEATITAEFGMKRIARAVGASVQSVSAADIIDSGRDNFVTALAGRVSGMSVSGDGTPGASTTVVLRSVTSISGSNQPLYVIDGIPMNNTTFDPSNFADGGDNFSVSSLDFSSRGNDLNPEDIESMTVLKGAAAAALYGSDASNGAIIITTKKGSAGKGRVTYSNSFSWSHSYGYPEVQTKYANGAYGTTNYYYLRRYGAEYAEGTKLYDNVGSIFQTGFTSKHNVALEAGNDRITIRASASFLDQTGVVKTTEYDRTNISLSGKGYITNWLQFEASMQYTSTKNHKVLRGKSGPLYNAYRWPLTDDITNYLDTDGSHMRYPELYTDTDLLNPHFALNKNKYYDESSRMLSNVALTLSPVDNFFLRAQVGWDVGMQTFQAVTHPYYAADNDGTGVYNLSKSNFSDPTINILAGYNNEFFNKKLTLSAQVGYHQIENGVTRVSTYGSNFYVVDFQSINNCDAATIVSTQRNSKRRVQAISAQVEFGYKNMTFLTLRARNDWSSTLPKKNNSYFYPGAEFSFVLTELPFLKDKKWLTYFKIRGAIAQVGKDASPLSINPDLEAAEVYGGGYKYGDTAPNSELKPEMTTSYEEGFEARFLNDRITADFTYFNTHCADQIVEGFQLSYATGFEYNTMNVGTFNTWGWEAHVDGDIIASKTGWRWNVGVNMSHTGSKVVYLPENVSEYYNPYTANSGNIRNGIIVGSPVTTITGLAYQRNDAGDILIDPTTGLPLEESTWSILGDREPLIRFGLTTALSWKGWRFSTMFSGRLNATVVNGTKREMMTNGSSWESVKLRESGPVVFDGVLKDGLENTDNPTVNTIAVSYTDYGAYTYNGGDEDWIEKHVHYLRLQEIRLTYKIPDNWLKRISRGYLSNASLYVSANDLFVLTNYSGIDAVGNTVSAAAGGTGGEGYDWWSVPNPRVFTCGLSITFN